MVKEQYKKDGWNPVAQQTVAFVEPGNGATPSITLKVHEPEDIEQKGWLITCLGSGTVRHAILLLHFNSGMRVIMYFLLFGKRYTSLQLT